MALQIGLRWQIAHTLLAQKPLNARIKLYPELFHNSAKKQKHCHAQRRNTEKFLKHRKQMCKEHETSP